MPVALLATAVCAAIAGLAWHDYTTTLEWQKSSLLLLDRRADEALKLLATAFTRDMHGARLSILDSFDPTQLTDEGLDEMRSDAAIAFARYPYVESLFAWRRLVNAEDVVFFNRAERRPQWASSRSPAPAFPVEVWKRAPFSSDLVSRIERDVVRGSRAAAFQIRLGGEDYQLVTRLLYGDAAGTALIGVFGFTVNLSWVREHYFPDLASQVAQIAGATDELTVTVLDDDGRDIVAIGGKAVDGSVRGRRLPLEAIS